MTTHAITLILSLAIPAILGIGILRRIGLGLRSSGFAYPAWVWIAGAFPIAIVVFLWAAAGLLAHHALVVASGVLAVGRSSNAASAGGTGTARPITGSTIVSNFAG